MKFVTVEPVLFLYMLVIFLESNALQELIRVKSCLKILNPDNVSDCFIKNGTSLMKHEIEQEKTFWVKYNGAFLFFFTFLSSFFVASWSDKFGRKFPMLIPPIGTVIAASINCVLSSFIYSRIEYLFISSTISGLTFGAVGIIATTFGFITDISDESSRTKRMMILEAMIYIGGTAGIYIAGEFLKHFDYGAKLNSFSQLFIFETVVAALICVYIIFRIPNNYGSSDSSAITVRNLFKLDHMKNAVRAIIRPRDNDKRKTVLLLSLSLFFIYFGLVVQFTLAYYLVNDVLLWDIHQYSTFNSIQFAVEGLALILGMICFHFLKAPDHLIASIGIISKMVGYIVFGLSNNDTLLYSCILWYMFSEYPVPAIRSILSKIVDADEKGRIFAFTTMLQNFSFLLGSLTLTTIYSSTLTFFPGLTFELVAGLQVIALCIIIYLYFTREEIITTYEVMENEDGSIEETCSSVRSIASIN